MANGVYDIYSATPSYEALLVGRKLDEIINASINYSPQNFHANAKELDGSLCRLLNYPSSNSESPYFTANNQSLFSPQQPGWRTLSATQLGSWNPTSTNRVFLRAVSVSSTAIFRTKLHLYGRSRGSDWMGKLYRRDLLEIVATSIQDHFAVH